MAMILLKTLIFTVLVPGTVTVVVPYWIVYRSAPLLSMHLGAFRAGGLLLIFFGTVIYLHCAWDFSVAGRGTPAPIDPPKELVVQGFYRYVRNPMYLSIFMVLLGEAVIFESMLLVLYAGVVLVLFHLRVVWYEEPGLRRKFGESYGRYCSTVPCWLPGRRSSLNR